MHIMQVDIVLLCIYCIKWDKQNINLILSDICMCKVKFVLLFNVWNQNCVNSVIVLEDGVNLHITYLLLL